MKNIMLYTFTSVELLEELQKWGAYSCGTVRSNRKQFPTELSEATLKDRLAQHIHVQYYNNTFILKRIGGLTRRLSDGTKIDAPCPSSISKYNTYMR